MLLSNCFSTFPIKANPIFSNGPKNLPKNSPVCPMLCNWVFDNFILANEPFGKASRIFETCILVNNSLWGGLFSSLESLITFDESFKVISVPFFILAFNLLTYALDNFTFKVL